MKSLSYIMQTTFVSIKPKYDRQNYKYISKT